MLNDMIEQVIQVPAGDDDLEPGGGKGDFGGSVIIYWRKDIVVMDCPMRSEARRKLQRNRMAFPFVGNAEKLAGPSGFQDGIAPFLDEIRDSSTLFGLAHALPVLEVWRSY